MRIIEKKFRNDRISDFSELIFCGIPFFYYNPEKIKLFSFTFEKNSAIYRFIEKADNFFYYKPGRTWCAQWLAAGKADKTTFEKDLTALLNGLPEKEKNELLLNLRREEKLGKNPSSRVFRELLTEEEKRDLKELAKEKKIKFRHNEKTVIYDGFEYLKDFFYGPDSSLDDKYEFIRKNIKHIKDRDIIDAGAFFGDSSLPFTRLTKGMVHAFEPDKRIFAVLEENIKLNGCSAISAINAGLGEKQESLFLEQGEDPSSGHLSRTASNPAFYKVLTETVDSYAEKKGLDIGFIKADIEGGERQMLKGAHRTIKRCHPLMLISIYHNYNDFFRLKPWLEKKYPEYEYHILFSKRNLLNASSFIAEASLAAIPAKEK